jgi:hypothetical protein
MSYASKLQSRLRANRIARDYVDPNADPDLRPATGIKDVHPGRYPKHADPAKGQVFEGVCNTTRCDSEPAVYFNRGTYALYCMRCGRGQNANDPVPISVRVTQKPTIAQMDAMQREMMEEMSALRRQHSKA